MEKSPESLNRSSRHPRVTRFSSITRMLLICPSLPFVVSNTLKAAAVHACQTQEVALFDVRGATCYFGLNSIDE
jgi:hypothetical protein